MRVTKIDISDWKPFHLYDIFDISMGNKFDKSKMSDLEPKINFVGRSALNNGVACQVDIVTDKNSKEVQPYVSGDITIAMGGSIGACFIQEQDFYTSQNVCVLHTDNPKVTLNVKHFIITSIMVSCRNYEAFVDELNRHIKTDFVIYLPINADNLPDFEYMEQYMRDLKDSVGYSLTAMQLAQNGIKKRVDLRNWKEFRISDLFNIKKGKRLTKAEMRDGSIRFIGASALNNGITAHISNKENIHPENTITLSYNGSIGEAFYQDEEFWASDDVNVLYPKFKMNREIAFFIIPLLKIAGKRYAFIDKWKKEDMEKSKILLPTDKNGNPDYKYMEDYISNKLRKVQNSLTNLKMSI